MLDFETTNAIQSRISPFVTDIKVCLYILLCDESLTQSRCEDHYALRKTCARYVYFSQWPQSIMINLKILMHYSILHPDLRLKTRFKIQVQK